MPFIFNFALRSKSNLLQRCVNIAEGKADKIEARKEMTIMASYLFISIIRIIIILMVYITYCFTQEIVLKSFDCIFNTDLNLNSAHNSQVTSNKLYYQSFEIATWQDFRNLINNFKRIKHPGVPS